MAKKNNPPAEKLPPIKVTKVLMEISAKDVIQYINLAAIIDKDAGWDYSKTFDSLTAECEMYSDQFVISGIRDEYEAETKTRLEEERIQKEKDLADLKRLAEKLDYNISENPKKGMVVTTFGGF